MTAKQEFYLLCRKKVPNKAEVKEFCSKHHSVQWREKGFPNIQIKFNDRENWIDVSEFADIYHSKVVKQVNDLLLSSGNVLTHGDLWNMTTAEFKHAISEYCITQASERGELATLDEYNQLVDDFNKQSEKLLKYEQRIQDLASEVEFYQNARNKLERICSIAEAELRESSRSIVIAKGDIERVWRMLRDR